METASTLNRERLARPLYSRKRVLAAVAVVFLAAAWLMRRQAAFQPEYWFAIVQANPTASQLLFVPVYALAIVFLLPTLPLNLLAGVLWGPLWGSIYAVCGSFLGAISAFFLSRATFGQPLAKRLDKGLVARLQDQFDRHGWKVVAFVRLNPIFPGPVNFLFGLTSINASTYVWATGIFLVPPTVLISIAGHGFGALAFRRSIAEVRTGALLLGAAILLAAAAAAIVRVRSVSDRKRAGSEIDGRP